MSFQVINGIKKEKPNYAPVYYRVYFDCLRRASEIAVGIEELDVRRLKQVVLFGVKMINTLDRKVKDLERFESIYGLCEFIITTIGHLTPNDLVNIFPISKDFDGERYQRKDYFFTKKVMREIGEDIRIADQVHDLLWDYNNSEIREFNVNYLSVISDIRRLKGQKGVMEEFCEKEGIATYTMLKDENGKEYIRNNQTNEVAKVRKPIPRYLKVIKNEKSPIPDQEN